MAEELNGQVGTSAAAPGSGAPERTGVPQVDRLLAEAAQVSELPVAERVAVFERVHEQLRRSLDADPSDETAGA